MMAPQNSHGENFARFSGVRSTRAEILNKVVMFARNETTTTSVLNSGVSALPVSKMALRKVSMLHAQKKARPR